MKATAQLRKTVKHTANSGQMLLLLNFIKTAMYVATNYMFNSRLNKKLMKLSLCAMRITNENYLCENQIPNSLKTVLETCFHEHN